MPQITIEEGRLRFSFDEQSWQAFKIDEQSAYTNGIQKLQKTKVVDIVGVFDNENLYFMEMKDFREHAIENRRRILSGDLTEEIALKVRDTIPCIISVSRNPIYADNPLWQQFKEKLCDTSTRIFVVAWVDFPKPTNLRQKQRANAGFNTKLLKKKLKWLNCKVIVASIEDYLSIPNLEVSNLPANN